MVFQQTCTLTKIINQQTNFYKDPGCSDITSSTMPQVAIQGLCAGSAQKNSPQQPEALRIGYQKMNGKVGIQCLENGKIIRNINQSENC